MTKWLKDTQVAEILNCSVQRLRNDRHLGRGLPYSILGRSVRYSEEEIYKHMEANKIVPDQTRSQLHA